MLHEPIQNLQKLDLRGELFGSPTTVGCMINRVNGARGIMQRPSSFIQQVNWINEEKDSEVFMMNDAPHLSSLFEPRGFVLPTARFTEQTGLFDPIAYLPRLAHGCRVGVSFVC